MMVALPAADRACFIVESFPVLMVAGCAATFDGAFGGSAVPAVFMARSAHSAYAINKVMLGTFVGAARQLAAASSIIDMLCTDNQVAIIAAMPAFAICPAMHTRSHIAFCAAKIVISTGKSMVFHKTADGAFVFRFIIIN